jgi:hypothetical protein
MHGFKRISALAALALGALAFSAQAQNATTVGVIAGVDFSSFNGSDADLSSVGFDKGSSTGFIGGVFVDIPAGKSLVFEPELLYVNKGATYSLNVSGASGDLNLNLNYIEVPVLLRYNFKPSGGLYLLIGPDVAFNVACNASGSGDVAPVLDGLPGKTCVDLGTLAGVPFDAESVTFGGIVGLGFQHQKFGLEGRYEFDFGDAFQGGDNIKNAVWEIMLRYTIK